MERFIEAERGPALAKNLSGATPAHGRGTAAPHPEHTAPAEDDDNTDEHEHHR